MKTREWKLQFNQYHFANNNEVTCLINKLIKVCSSSDTAKDIFADLTHEGAPDPAGAKPAPAAGGH